MKTYSILIGFTCLFSGIIYSQTTAISDSNFEDYLETHAEDGTVVNLGDSNSMGDGIANNGLVSTNSINEVVSLDVSNLGIEDLTGIEDFIALETLFCSSNNLATLNVSNNSNLVSLICGSNSFSDLVLNNNTNLETLNCSDNQIQNLDLSNNTVLRSLTVSGNQLSDIDVSFNTDLTLLSVSDNRIVGELVVSNNTDLENLFCASNQISTLDLSPNTLLKNLDASGNALTSLDLSTMNSSVCPEPQTDPVTPCQSTSSVNVSNNLLNALVLANGFNDLISIFDASDNPDLFCIQIDAGFTPNGWLKDDWAYYSENTCVDIFTYVPDDNFEQALIDQGYDDILDNLVLTANIESLTSLDVSNASISSLVGIEDFLALEILNCNINTIENIDLSANTSLLELDASDNDLSILDLSSNIALTALDCATNLIESLDLSNNLDLTTLNCSNNNLTGLDVNGNIALMDLDGSNNQIESLDVTSNINLTSLTCNDNNLFALNIDNGNNTALTTFNASNNTNLFCIKVDNIAFANGAAGWQKDVTATYNLNCGTYIPDDNFEQALIDQGIDSDGALNNFVPTADVNGITVLDVSNLSISDLTGIEDFVALQNLNLSNNTLSTLDLNNNTALQILDCSINQIAALDLTANTALTSVLCNYNALNNLNIENGNNGALTVFNTTENPNLFCINVDDTIIGSIPDSWQKDDFASYNGDCINNRFTAIPDAFFEQALIDYGYDDIMDGRVLTSNIEHIETLDVNDQGISDLTGIRDFKSLLELDCSGNFLDELDVSDMIYLKRLNCSSNYLLSNDTTNANGVFNTTGTIALMELFCAGNNLADLDTSLNANLEVLDCADNNIVTLNIDNNGLLRRLNCSNNALLDLDMSNSPSLENVNCDNNQLNNLTTINTVNTTLTQLSCANNELSDLQVDNYQGLTNLNCSSNALTQLVVSNITALEILNLTSNQLTDIDLNNNSNLVELSIAQNELSQLVLSSNTLLERLSCGFNDITQLNLDVNVLLQLLSSSSNQLVNLDLNNNIDLIEINVSSNMLTGITLSNNLGNLKRLNISNNQIETGLDLSTMSISACVFEQSQTDFCPQSISIDLSNNLLDFVNIQNGINGDIANFNASGNPNLECIQVDDADATRANWIKDETAIYSEDCNFGETYVPDDNFEQALIDLGYDSGPLNDYVLTANIESLVSLDVSGNSIADLTGIEDFIALQNLNCSNNTLNAIELSSNLNLLQLDCSNNQLTNLDVSSNTDLTTLNTSSNSLIDLDLNSNTNLSDLNISSNAITSFLAAEVVSLEIFNCDDNQITELDFQQNQVLTTISCQSNQLETLNIRNGQNAILINLNATINPDLFCIQTDDGMMPSGATWVVDATAQFAIECFFGQTYVPDDNFEQALIDIGYDTGALDDYVVTETIAAITFLNISSRQITDLTGIEDFVSLASLDLEDNSLTTIDLSNNVLLSNLDISDNMIAEIELSYFPNLTSLDVSNNTLTQLSFENNLNLINLNVSNNLIANLDVAALFGLEDFSCAFNELSRLDVTQNPNLNILFCQSNMLVGDQLNIQNGNNENLQIFNAINNPGLGCILVDNPVAVIENLDGTYDNWSKDDSATYQTICEDADNDGVPNEDDLCPGTEFGATVDLFGCAVINLPNDNFTISITGETCLNSNNGKITITAKEIFSYTVSLMRGDFKQDYNFTNDIDIFNLLAGTYEMCITIEEWPDYRSCYTIVITQPDPLEVFSSRSASGSELSVVMSGNSSYHIEFNGESFTTYNPVLTFELQQGVNTLKVSTDIECQGVYEESIVQGDGAFVYPNPFGNSIKIHTYSDDKDVTINIYSMFGQLVVKKSFVNQMSDLTIDTSELANGMYLMTIASKSINSTFKMIKE